MGSETEALLNYLVRDIHKRNVDAGWWNDLETGEDKRKNKDFVMAKFALIHSEVSEAVEGYRKGLKDDHLKDRDMTEVECADVLIRLFDILGALEYNQFGETILRKLDYNANRADHKIENRKKEGGKSI